jgi:hypothetical protein
LEDIITVHVHLEINFYLFSAVLPILQENILTQSKSMTIPRKTKNGNKLILILNFSLKDKDVVLFKEIQKIY